MESYPEDLLVGVFPLVFCVNAFFDAQGSLDGSDQESTTAASPKTRSDFDRFLDAMAASLVDGNDDNKDDSALLEFQPVPTLEGLAKGPSSGRNVSLFRPDDDDMEDSSDEDLLLDTDDDESKRRSSTSTNIRLYAGFGLSRKSSGGGAHSHQSVNTSYAKALQHGQGFFQRARIISISSKHGFPPSKDPQGTDNIVHALKQARYSAFKARTIFADRPINGILPAGWLQKHVYALPSVILVVVRLSTVNQDAQNSHLIRTVENLHYSLVPKRPCKIHVVCLVEDGISVAYAEQWSLNMSRQIVEDNPNTLPYQQESHQMTLLRASKDLRSGTDGFPTSAALKRLHRSVRDSSLQYYLGQARRTKQKLAKLSEGGRRRLSTTRQRVQPPKELLPLAIRYCFKAAMFYEFQLKFEKSLKFMAEAYRYVRNYYHHLIRLMTRGNHDFSDDDEGGCSSHGMPSGPRAPTKVGASNVSISSQADTEDTEVSIVSDQSPAGGDESWTAGIPLPPSDMAHQCLAVADWLNFKLLQAGFGSHTEGGLLAAAAQWRQHSRVFCTRRFLGGHPIMAEDWYFWCHVAHQRLVMSQLVERHPPRALGDFGNDYDEVLLRCAPWRAYEAAAEAFLKAGVSVQRAIANHVQSSGSEAGDDSRAPFLGSLDRHSLANMLTAQSKDNHRGKALELVERAIAMFEHEWGKEKLKDAEDPFPHRSWGRFGARIYYLAGGILFGMDRFADAAVHLEKAAKYSKGWSGLELVIRRLLVECYEKNIPSESEDIKDSVAVASMILESCFNAKMTPDSLRSSLSRFAAASGIDTFKWNLECFDEADPTLPLSFAVTFPNKSHATAGDTVEVSVVIRSNMDYAICVTSLTLLSSAGPVLIPSKDLLSSSNANEGSNGGIVILPRAEICFSTSMDIPKDLDAIATDDSTSEKATKSFTKSARPRTSGIVAAAGARLVSEEKISKSPKNNNAQWSLNFLGGKAMRCDGVQVAFYPLPGEAANPVVSEDGKSIELTVTKKKPKPAPNVKKTPFEEDNYIGSAWSRPLDVPLPKGPRCLRVLGPEPDMEVTDLTYPVLKGNAVEGTVNRICLQLKSGPNELCDDIKYKVSLSSMVATSDGTNLKLVSKELSAEDPEKCVDMHEPKWRTPALVAQEMESTSPRVLDYGYSIPAGWKLEGSGQESGDFVTPKALTTLQRGESTFVFFEVFRPSPITDGAFSLFGSGSAGASPDDICQTDFEVSIQYRQKRLLSTDDGTGQPNTFDSVTKTFNGSVSWCAPLKATFSRGAKTSCPSGSRHPSNLTDDVRPSDTSVFTNVPIIDGERVSMRGGLERGSIDGEIDFEIVGIRFDNDADPDSPCDLKAVSGDESHASGVVYEAEKSDPCRLLSEGSKFSFVYNVEATIKISKRSATFPLGIIAVDWLPTQIDLPGEVRTHPAFDKIDTHGPLALKTPLSVTFRGPPCYIEKAPFCTSFQCNPSVPKASVPFEVKYDIVNKTNTHQVLSVSLDGRPDENDQEILVCGLLNGELRLAPNEAQSFSYTAIATRPGMTKLPQVYIASTRYNSWVVNENAENSRPLCIMP